MFFIEMVIAFVNPILVIPISLYLYKTKRNSCGTAFWLAFAYGYFAYWAQSHSIGDIERYILMLPKYNEVGFINALNYNYDGLIGLNIFFWICSHFSDPRMLVFCASFIMYFSLFYIVLSYCKEEEISYKNTILIVFGIMMIQPLYKYISAMRSSIALSLFSLAVYRELYLKKKNCGTYSLYILCILFHDGAIAAVLLRIAFAFFQKYKNMLYLLIFGGLFFLARGSVILAYLPENRFVRALEKILSFSSSGVHSTSKWTQVLRNSTLAKFYQVYVVVTIVVVIYKYWKKKNVSCKDKYYEIIIGLMVYILGMMFFSTSLYMRYVIGFMPLCITLVCKLCLQKEKHKRHTGVYSLSQICFIGISVIGGGLQLVDLSNAVELGSYFEKVLLGVINLFV